MSEMACSSPFFKTMANAHFYVTRRAADALGVTVITTLQHCVLVRTDRGPRFMGRSKFDQWEVAQRLNRARHCSVRIVRTNAWEVEDPSTKSGLHTVTCTGAHSAGIDGRWQCTCTDAHFMIERGQTPCCKHVLAAQEACSTVCATR